MARHTVPGPADVLPGPVRSRLRAVLEVIERDHDCADTYATRQAMAFGFVVERDGRLLLTRSGLREVSR